MVFRFSGFELDSKRAELRGPDGTCHKLRPKTLSMLCLFVANRGKVLTKQELMEAVWPQVHVGEDSVFQCIREIRTVLGDEQRQLIRLISGQGYVFTPEIEDQSLQSVAEATAIMAAPEPTVRRLQWRSLSLFRKLAVGLGLGAAAGLAIAAATLSRDRPASFRPPVIAVTPLVAADDESMQMAVAATTRLVDGLAQIENIRLIEPQASAATPPEFVVSGELRKAAGSWKVRARMTRVATGEILWTAPVSIAIEDADTSLQEARVVAAIGYPLAERINELLSTDTPSMTDQRDPPAGVAKVAITQAADSITETTQERFATAQTLLEKALAGDSNNVDLAVALAALQLRGVQMDWYKPADGAAALINAKSILERALRLKPTNLAVLDTYCRSLNATNDFLESLLACSRALNFNPWDGQARFHIGLAQLQLGRFEDALVSFKEADRADTPKVSRWTWQIGAGWAYMVMGRAEEAIPWINRSIAITPASGRSYMLLAAAYQLLGQETEAKAAMAKGMALRPGSNLGNVIVPTRNASPAYLSAKKPINQAFLDAGLPAE